MSDLVGRVAELERIVAGMLRGEDDLYPGRARREDDKLRSEIDRLAYDVEVVSFGLYDPAGSSASRAPADAEYIVATTNATLSAERVATDTASITWNFGTAAQAKANVVFGSTGSTACVGNDSRLSDSRTPTLHASSHRTGGSDVVWAPDSGWTAGTHSTKRSLATGDTLGDTQDFVITLVAQMLAEKWPVA